MCNILSLWIQSFTVGPAKMEPQENGAFQISTSTNTPAEKVLSEELFSHPCFSSYSVSACGSVCLPVCRGRCSISLTRLMVLWFSLIPKLPLVTKTLQGLRAEMEPQLEGKLRGPDQKHRCISQHSLFMPAVQQLMKWETAVDFTFLLNIAAQEDLNNLLKL